MQRTGRIEWVNDLAEIPAQYGVKNVYGDLGQIFAQSTMADPRVCAFMMGTLIKGLGDDHVVWGSDAVWTGSPQWQIEALRRLEIPDEMQKKYGFKPLGPADGPVKRAILGDNNARLYNSPRSNVRPSKTTVLRRSRKITKGKAKAAATAPTVTSLNRQLPEASEISREARADESHGNQHTQRRSGERGLQRSSPRITVKPLTK